MELFVKADFNYCPSCDSDSIELYNADNHPIDYNKLLRFYNKGYDISNILNSVELSYFKCKNCGKKYIIDWRKDHFPKPFIMIRG